MKIYILPVNEKFRPKKQGFTYPEHNSDYGVEQDFYKYIIKNKALLTDNHQEADWHYLPVFWTRWHLNHNYGKEGLEELQIEINTKIIDALKTFIICQYDDGPLVDIGDSIQFLASRKSDKGIDIPLLSKKHRMPLFTPKKKFIATFSGRIENHPIRKKMMDKLVEVKDVSIINKNKGSSDFVKRILSSHISLCPRGYGGSSFRFFESMELGVVPLLLGEPDTRPFKNFINWNTISLYSKNTTFLKEEILLKKPEELKTMGEEAKKVFYEKLAYEKWCPYVLKELELLNP